MTTFEKATDETAALVEMVKAKYHQRLVEADVTVSTLMAHAPVDPETDEATGPALRLHGVPCLAIIRIVKLSDRVQGMADAEMKLDGDRWDLLSLEEQVAVIDHELTHLVVKGGDTPNDDHGRPKLKMREHDFEVGWFHEIAERHGRMSQEQQQAQALVDGQGNVYFAFMTKAQQFEYEIAASAKKRAEHIAAAEQAVAAARDIRSTLQGMADKAGGPMTISIELGGERVSSFTAEPKGEATK